MRISRLVTTSLLLVTACGGPAGPTPSPVPTPPPTPTTPPPPTPADVERLDILATGVGIYQLVTVPVALVHNVSVEHSAVGVVVHFTPQRGNGSALQSVDTPTVNLAPGATVAFVAYCTDSCTGATQTAASVTVGEWSGSRGAPLMTASPGNVVNGGGGGQASVTATVTAAVPGGSLVEPLRLSGKAARSR